MEDLKDKITQLSELMQEFRLAEAELSGEDWRVAFRRRPSGPVGVAAPLAVGVAPEGFEEEEEDTIEESVPTGPAGTPVESPMNGIFYTAANPQSPPFVQEGASVSEGDVVGLIEAMKVFNEITAPKSGTVTKVVAGSGDLVQPGDPLIYID